MKRTFAFILTFVLLFATVTIRAETDESTQETNFEYDFKSFIWGDSMEAVKAVEGEPILDGTVNGMDANYIAYERTAVGLDMVLAYYFCDDGLFQVRYILSETHSNESLYIDDYETFKDALTQKYGETVLDFENWENSSKKKYYADDKGNALCYGYLTYSTYWFLDRTNISMDMRADNYEITMTVDYVSTEISPGEADFSDEI